jgi:hypothetical protein
LCDCPSDTLVAAARAQFADDYGGPYRSSIVQMCQELQDWVLPLFMPVRVRAIWVESLLVARFINVFLPFLGFVLITDNLPPCRDCCAFFLAA